MDASRRLAVVLNHLDSERVGHGVTRPDILGLQQLLDHDNHELRARMKQHFMQDDIYIPRYVGPELYLLLPGVPASPPLICFSSTTGLASVGLGIQQHPVGLVPELFPAHCACLEPCCQ